MLGFLKNDEDLAKCVELGAKNDNVLDIYVSHTVFDFFDATSSSQQHVGNAEHNDDSDSDLDDVFVYDSESEESETASVDHLPDGEEEVYDARTRKPDTAPKKMFDANFLSRIYNGLPRDEHAKKDVPAKKNVPAEKDVSDEDNLGDHWPIHDANFEAAKQVMPLLSIDNMLDTYMLTLGTNTLGCNTGICFGKQQRQHTPQGLTSTDKACDAVKNGISECFNSMIVDARRKPIINMLEDIRVLCMEILQKMREKHAKMNGMDQWPTTDYQKPLPHIVRRMPERPPHKRKRNAIEDDGNKTRIRTASVGQVSATSEIVSVSVGKVTAASEIVSASGGNVTASGGIVTVRGGNVTARGGKVSARGGKVTARGGIVMENGGNVSARGGKVTASRGKVTARGGKVSARGGKVPARGRKVTATPSTPCTPPPGFEMSTPNTASSAVRTSGGAIKLREGGWIRSPEKERSSYADYGSSSMNKLRTVNGKVVSSRGRGDRSKSRMYPFGIRPIGFAVSWDPIDGQTTLGNSMGLPRHAWPEGITPQDCIIHAATQFEIALSQSQQVESQEEEPRQQQPSQQQPRQQEPRQQEPRQQQPTRTSKRIAHIMFNSHYHMDLDWIQMMQFH
ncbi:transposase, MuDR, plant [Tanacetum coccineum]